MSTTAISHCWTFERKVHCLHVDFLGCLYEWGYPTRTKARRRPRKPVWRRTSHIVAGVREVPQVRSVLYVLCFFTWVRQRRCCENFRFFSIMPETTKIIDRHFWVLRYSWGGSFIEWRSQVLNSPIISIQSCGILDSHHREICNCQSKPESHGGTEPWYQGSWRSMESSNNNLTIIIDRCRSVWRHESVTYPSSLGEIRVRGTRIWSQCNGLRTLLWFEDTWQRVCDDVR